MSLVGAEGYMLQPWTVLSLGDADESRGWCSLTWSDVIAVNGIDRSSQVSTVPGTSVVGERSGTSVRPGSLTIEQGHDEPGSMNSQAVLLPSVLGRCR